jgi:biopolymer transport protein TolR
MAGESRRPWPDELSAIDDERVDLNLTSLVDVVFALLIVFMVSSAALYDDGHADRVAGEVELSLPSGSTAVADVQPAGEFALQVDANGNLFHAGEATDRRDLRARLATKLAKDPELQVRIEADQGLTYQQVMDVIAELQEMGVRNVGLGTRGRDGAQAGDDAPADDAPANGAAPATAAPPAPAKTPPPAAP